MIDPVSIMLWVKVGTELVQVGKTTVQQLRGAVADDPEANLAILEKLDADYDRRIWKREHAGE